MSRRSPAWLVLGLTAGGRKVRALPDIRRVQLSSVPLSYRYLHKAGL